MNRVRTARERERMLVAMCAAQRLEVGAAIAPWQAPLALLDRAMGAIHHVRHRPMLAAGVVLAAVTVIGPRRVLRGLRRGGAAWLAARLLRPH